MLTDRSRIARSLCSSLAIATALLVGSGMAQAQSFQGNGTFNSGTGGITTSAGTTTVSITSSNAVIDWTTFDTTIGGGPINFQPNGTTATFQSVSDFTVLNRIVPTDPSRAVQFNGNVIAQIQGTSPIPGGDVFFYSPGGIIVGSTAVFNVANLGLTSAAPQVVGGAFIQGSPPNEFINFTTANPGTAVTIQAGAQINSDNNSYLAVVAPRVTNAGTITGERVAALVSADSAVITLNMNGLFDIQVTSGTSSTGTAGDGRTLVNTGTITGPAGDPGVASRIYLVAVPKNTAITMIVGDGSTLGFDIADAADVVGNAVILSAGYDVVGGAVASTRSAGGGTGSTAIDAFNSNFTSDVAGRATGRALFASDGTVGAATTKFAAGVTVHSDTIVSLEARNGGPLSVVGNVLLDASNAATLNGASATGGQAYLDSRGGASLTIGGNAILTAVGSGANSNLAGVAVGNGTGGQTSIFSTGTNSLISIGGLAQQQAFGFAGSALVAGALPGSGTGGGARITADSGGRVAITGNADLNVQGSGMSTATPGTDGSNGVGGIAAISQSTGGRITVGGNVLLLANGFGGHNYGGGDLTAGNGTGGDARFVVNDAGGLQAGGNVIIDATGVGGDGLAATGNSIGGTGRGGLANVGSINGLNLILGNATLTAQGFGGNGVNNSSMGGAGIGGTAIVGLIPGTSGAITIGNGGTSFVGAGGFGGGGVGGGSGGSGTGGTAQVFGQGGIVTILDAIDIHAVGNGGSSVNGTAGAGIGGFSSIRSDNAGSAVRFTGSGLTVGQSGAGFGGNASGTGAAGAATGGTSAIDTLTGGQVSIAGVHDSQTFAGGGTAATGAGGAARGGITSVNANTGTITLSNGSTLTSSAFGGSSGGAGAGGNATGGTSTYFTSPTGGSIAITGPASARSQANGGNSASGAGGNAVSTAARFLARNGTLTVSGLAEVSANATGGDGRTAGGNATGGDAAVVAGNVAVGGAILFGATSIDSGADGGDGTIAGTGTGGTSRIVAGAGSVSVTGLAAVSSRASGGDGVAGGAGGNATAGTALINALNNVGAASSITLGTTVLFGDAFGGVGGAGLPGGAGGAGGVAMGGNVQALGGAGNGTLSTGTLTTSAIAFGGSGGAGGTGATGGAGGAGGNGLGGFIQVGTASFFDNSPTNTGSGTFGAASEDASAFGGNGGAGGSGTTAGVGGRGGDAFDGATTILVRGSAVRFNGAVTLDANAVGGNGGAGSTAGAGGNATVGTDPVVLNSGGIGVTVTDRFQHPEQPGSLTAGTITGNAFATAGTGSTPGASVVAGSPIGFNVSNSTATISSLSLNGVGAVPQVGAVPSFLTFANSTATVSNLFLNTLGTLSVSLDASTINTSTLFLSASNFVLPAVRPAVLGTINVSSGLTISSALDFLAYSNFNVGFAGGISAVGSVLTGDLTFAGPLDLTAGGSITTGLILAGDVALGAGQSINTLAVTANGGSIDIDAGGPVTTGQLTSSDTVEVSAVGVVNVAGASAGIVNPSTSPTAEYNIGLRSLAAITAGSLSARANVGLSSPGTIAVGNVTAGIGILALAGTGLTTGSLATTQINGARIYLANFSMEALGGQIASSFDPTPILAANPVAIAGPVAINGTVTGTVFQVNTTQSLAISGNASLVGAAILLATGPISAANIDTGDRVLVASGGAVTLGNVTSGTVLTPGQFAKISIAGTSVTVASASALRDLGIQSSGAITTGALRGRDVLLLGGTGVTTGSILAGSQTQPTGRVYVGNVSQTTANANVFTNFISPTGGLAIFNAVPVAVGGALTFNGGVSAGSLIAAATQGISLQAVTTPALSTQTGSGGFIDLTSGGTVTINGRLAAGQRIDIVSRDIDITQTGSLDALSSTGEIQLASNNPNGAFIGDGLTTTSGYILSNAEYGRLRAGHINVIGDDISSLATDLTVGTLTINASQLYGANGLALFASGNRDTETPSGILRIAGAIAGSGFSPTTELELLSGTVELEAEKGSIKISSGVTDTGSTTSSSLGGLIVINADRIHVASDAILTKLRADPLYTGHIDELNAPATVQRTDGVLNALGLDVIVGKTFYIQNTGSRIVPAGFLTTNDATDVFVGANPPTGGAEIVLNGQFQTSTGTVTGKAAYDLVVTNATPGEPQFANFSSTSQLNGCVFLSGVCAIGGNTQMAPPASEISVIISAVLAASPPPPPVEDAGPGDSSASASDSEAAADEADSSDDEKKDEGDGDEAASPIAPPAPLISTRALDGDVNVVEPVSGAGNPALFGSAVNETTVQGGKP